jgi:dolichol-phosphate mannosyltransferase
VSVRGLWRLAKTAIFSFSTFPLFVFTLIGYVALSVFAGLACFTLFCKLFTSLAIPGWTSEVLTASFFGAVNALGISMLGEYVVRIYDQVRGRPLYLVERAVNSPGERCTRSGLTRAEKDECYEQLLRDAEELVAMAEPGVREEPTPAAVGEEAGVEG